MLCKECVSGFCFSFFCSRLAANSAAGPAQIGIIVDVMSIYHCGGIGTTHNEITHNEIDVMSTISGRKCMCGKWQMVGWIVRIGTKTYIIRSCDKYTDDVIAERI